MYDKPRCSQVGDDGQLCRYEPVHKCQRCGKLICLIHSSEFKSPNSGPDWVKYNGIFCPSCVQISGQEHDQLAKSKNIQNGACTASSCACDCFQQFCRMVAP
jgi:hypothetical protein